MSGRIEKTIFISYRRTNLPWALAIFQNLSSRGYDVFFDFQSINSGDFEQIILGNIKARAHFIVLLTASAIERCSNPKDWLRREIETAIDSKRNIIPVMLEGFEFGTSLTAKYLTGKLALLTNYNGLRVHSDYFEESVNRLCERYLNVPLDMVLHPMSNTVKESTQEQQSIANKYNKVEKAELYAQERLDNADVFKYPDKTKLRKQIIRYFNREEFETLCTDFQTSLATNGLFLMISLANFGEKGFEYQVRDMLDWLQRRGLYEDFVDIIRSHRGSIF
jgi:hypothetical protein